MAAYIPLLNHKLDRSTLYYETIKIPAGGVYKLKYIPREDGFIVTGYTLAPSNSPTSLQYWIDFREDYDYWGCNRDLYFNLADVGSTVNISYYPVGSNVDADDLNPVLNWYNDNIMDVAYKSKLKTNGQAEVHWGNLTNVPPLADDVRWGFMSSQCYIKSMFVDESKYPLGGFTLNGTNIVLGAWGERQGLKDTQTIKLTRDVDGNFLFNVDVLNTPGILGKQAVDATAGTFGSPSATNRFVTENDPRFISHVVSSNSHPISDVLLLQTTLDGKSDVGHKHEVADTNGLQAELDDKSAVGHKHELADTNGLVTALAGKSATDHRHLTLENSIGQKSPIGHTHTASDIPDILSMIPQPQAVNIYDIQKETTNVSALITDWNISGLVSTKAMEKYNVDIAPGVQYAGGVRIAYPGGKVNVLAPTSTNGGSTPAGRYLELSGAYNRAVAQHWTVTVAVVNKDPGMINGIVLTVHDVTTPANADFNLMWDGNTAPLMIGAGVYIKPYFDGSTTQYVVGDTWTVSIATSGWFCSYLTNQGTIKLVNLPVEPGSPPVVPGAVHIGSGEFDSSGISYLQGGPPTSKALSATMKTLVQSPITQTPKTLSNATTATVTVANPITSCWIQQVSDVTGTFTNPPRFWVTTSGNVVTIHSSSNTVSADFIVFTC